MPKLHFDYATYLPRPRASHLTLWQRLTVRPVQFSCVVLTAFLLICAVLAGIVVHLEVGAIASLPPGAAVYAAPPAATLDPYVASMEYLGAMAPDLDRVDADLIQLGVDCDAGKLGACNADAHTLTKDAQTAQQHRNQHPVPPCLAALDQQYHTLLDVLSNTASEMSTGIDTNNSGMLRQATSDMNDAFTMMEKTATVLGQTACA